ncbi:MAG: hydrogenase maturation factor [Clostridia bacterium]|jgi:hydrogenase expression/formation protein HypE|nr:hydrogenase maturation factor [Clostridia bacterium]
MKEGKIPSELLRELVFNNIKVKHEDVILRPEIGEDCTAIEFGDYACVLSTDPITGAEKGIGALAVHISCNDVASSGVKPLALLMTIMAPPSTTEEDIRTIMKDAGEAAALLDVEIAGGHTEITSAVNKVIVSTTAIGKILKHKLVKTSGACIGDAVVMTKYAGLEGTAILAKDRERELHGKLTDEQLERAKNLSSQISVVKEGVLAGEFGVNSMHDVTEGGILGAAWEVAESSNTGIEIYLESIPVLYETYRISEVYNLNPYRLISSGSMIITCSKGNELVQHLKAAGITAAVIGKIVEKDKTVIENGIRKELDPPGPDELFKV